MKKKIELITSGVSLVDGAWGGFYRGGTYLMVGPRKSGRTLLGLQYAMECARQKEVCLYFTSMRPKDLMIHAASIDFDLQHYMNQNLIIVVRVAPPADLYEVGNPDDFLVEYLKDIVTVVEQYQPQKIVFDELTPFVGFDDVNLLYHVFLQTCETIEESGITSLFIVGEPATPATKEIVDALSANVTGMIFLQRPKDTEGRTQGGRMSIIPNIGHTEGEFTANYYIEPYKGIVVEHEASIPVARAAAAKPVRTEEKYTILANMDLPKEDYSYSNFYNANDFKLILNNQIALFKSTGQVFTILSFKFDHTAEQMGLLTLNQLKNAIRLSTDKKDKICVIEDKVVVLITKEDQQAIKNIIAKVKSNLPGDDPSYITKVVQYISVYAIRVDEKTRNADEMLHELLLENVSEKNRLGFFN
jgi:circadian clock protein KaiC